jgi:hypothetical protein
MPNLKDIEKQAAALLGYTVQSVGKTQARQKFFPMVNGLSASASVVEITDHDKPVAVLLSYHHFVALTTKLCMLGKISDHPKPPDLIGSIQINCSSLEVASERVAATFKQSIERTSRGL